MQFLQIQTVNFKKIFAESLNTKANTSTFICCYKYLILYLFPKLAKRSTGHFITFHAFVFVGVFI